ncbi:MAG: PAS domain S-box protein [archaeon]
MGGSGERRLGLDSGSEEILQSFAPHPYQSLNADGSIVAVNEAWLDCLGYNRDDVIGRWFGDLLTDESQTRFESRFDEFKTSGRISNVAFKITRSDGGTVVVVFDGVIEYDEQGDFVRTHCQFTDITKQKEREREFEESNTVLRTIIENMSMGVLVENADRNILMTNERLLQILDVSLSADDLIGQDCAGAAENLKELFADPASFVNGIDRRISKREPVHDEVLKLADGRVLERDYIPYELPEGPANLWIYRDVTDRKEREDEVNHLKERLELAIDGANLGVWDWDMRTDKVEFNDTWATMLGYDPEEIDSQLDEWKTRVHPDDMETVEEAVDANIAGETTYYETEHRMRTASGNWKWIRDIGTVFERNDEGELIRAVGVHIDINERKEYEQELERTREDLRKIIDLVPDLIFVKERDGEYLLANETTADAYGLSPEGVEGSKEHEIIPDVEESESFREDDLVVIESGEPKEIPEEELTTADGETKILQTIKIPFEVSDSDEDAVLGYSRDVTELKEYERTLERQRDNLEVLNQIVRHDIRNKLQLVLGHAEMLEEHVEEGGEEYIQQIRKAGRKSVDITETARDVSGIVLHQGTDRSLVRLRPVLEHEIDEIRSSNDRVVVTVDGSIPTVEVLADDMLESIFRNLLTNAIVHNDKDVPEVTISATTTDELARVRIADNGPGIPDTQKERIFDEGETGIDTEGTGLGLYLVQTLMVRYDGDIWVEDNEPEGSVFVVELPTVN